MLSYLQQLLEERGHAVICVAEGAGQNLMYPGKVGLWSRIAALWKLWQHAEAPIAFTQHCVCMW
jgi:hypothetical protein